jgi:hypothetical protein
MYDLYTFGNYRYNRLPMGICQSPYIAQEAMEDLLRLFEEANVYIDNIGIFSNNWSDHLLSLSKILTLCGYHMSPHPRTAMDVAQNHRLRGPV